MLSKRGLIGLAAACALSACLSGSGEDNPPTQPPTEEAPHAADASAATFGVHYPHGRDAVDYLYGPEGTWRDQTGLHYQWNYYAHCATASHPANRPQLIADASTFNVTAPDVNCLLLGDVRNDGSILDDHPTGPAFHEHAGKGVGGLSRALPFYQFWFDDNWLARYMARAYGREQPAGLHDHDYSVRWRVLGGDKRNWSPYSSPLHVDELALNGIYRLNAGDIAGALAHWRAIRDQSAWQWNETTARHDYGAIAETYHLALWAILSERLLACSADYAERHEVLQHAMSLRSHLLTLQQVDSAGMRNGWTTGIDNPLTLINTETVALAALALAANATWVFEAGYAPLGVATDRDLIRRADSLAAFAGRAQAGYIVLGPNWTLPTGTYEVEFSLRTRSKPYADLATLDVHDGAELLASEVVSADEAPNVGEWNRFSLIAAISNAGNRTQFRVFWHGTADLEVGAVRVLRRAP